MYMFWIPVPVPVPVQTRKAPSPPIHINLSRDDNNRAVSAWVLDVEKQADGAASQRPVSTSSSMSFPSHASLCEGERITGTKRRSSLIAKPLPHLPDDDESVCMEEKLESVHEGDVMVIGRLEDTVVATAQEVKH